jgi:hypothetical protein
VTGPLLPDGAKLNLKIESLEVIGVGVPSIAADFVEWYETFLAAQPGAGIIWDDTAHQTYSDTVNTTCLP